MIDCIDTLGIEGALAFCTCFFGFLRTKTRSTCKALNTSDFFGFRFFRFHFEYGLSTDETYSRRQINVVVVVVVVVVFTLKAVPVSTQYQVLSNIRTGPTDANAFRGHRLTTQKGYT